MQATIIDGKSFWEPKDERPLDPWSKLVTALFVSSFKALMHAWKNDDFETAKKELEFLLKTRPDTEKCHNYLNMSPEFVLITIERIRIKINSQK